MLSLLTFTLLSFSLTFLSDMALAQCPANQTEVKALIRTDNYGHETFWQIKNAATNLVLKTGGNALAYPGGQGGTAAGNPGAYPNNTIRRDSLCVNDGTTIKFLIYDAYGDGMCCNYGNGYYEVYVDEQMVVSSAHFTSRDSNIFLVPTPTVDIAVENIVLGNKITKGNHFIEGYVRNKGTDTITSYTLNWSVDNGTVRTETYSNLSIPTNGKVKFSHKYGWAISDTGAYNLKLWISDVNGNGNDEFILNDSILKAVTVFQNNRVVLVEAWTNASCPPCARYMPPLEELLDVSNNHVISVMYHSDYPGFDLMNTHNPTQVDTRGNYYSVNSYPSWFVDGEDLNATFVTESKLYTRSLVPATFDFIEPKAWIDGDTIYGSVGFQAKSNFTGNFRAHAIVIEREMDFTSGPNPGSNGEKTFDWVMKYMLTGTGGKNIGSAFVAGQSDSLSGKWKLANVNDTAQLAIVYFIQNNSGKEIQAAVIEEIRQQPDYTEPVNSGIAIAENGTVIKTYPNPAQNIFNIELAQLPQGLVNVEVFSISGQQVANLQLSKNSGSENIHLNTESFGNGVYIVKISGNQFSHSTRLIISK